MGLRIYPGQQVQLKPTHLSVGFKANDDVGIIQAVTNKNGSQRIEVRTLAGTWITCGVADLAKLASPAHA